MSEQKINNLIEHFNLYKTSHPNLVNCWTIYLELKKKNQDNICYNEYGTIFNYLNCGKKDYTNEDIMRVLIFKASLLDDSLFNMI